MRHWELAGLPRKPARLRRLGSRKSFRIIVVFMKSFHVIFLVSSGDEVS
jgi:hypothetical protein